MLELLIDNIFVMFGGRVFQRVPTVLIADFCLRQTSYRGFSRKAKFSYRDPLASLNNY